MQPPDELMSQAFLPSMRQLVAVQLHSRGLSQNKISSLLGITQASVSMYLSTNAKKSYQSLSDLSVQEAEADLYAAQLAAAVTESPSAGVTALYSVWTSLLGRGSVCPAHRAQYPSLSDCDLCIKEYGLRGARSETIGEVSDAVRLLEESPKFVDVMPEVSVNIACAMADASTSAGVVAIPGRIVKVKGRAKAMLPPEAGASAHMAHVLLLVKARSPDFRACVNLKYDRKMAQLLQKEGLKAVSLANYPQGGVADPTVAALERKLQTTRGRFDAVVDEGGGGIEPNLYLFSTGAREVARLALRLAWAYSTG